VTYPWDNFAKHLISFFSGALVGIALTLLAVYEHAAEPAAATETTLYNNPETEQKLLEFYEYAERAKENAIPPDIDWLPPYENEKKPTFQLMNPDLSGPGWTYHEYQAPSGNRYILPIPPGTCEPEETPCKLLSPLTRFPTMLGTCEAGGESLCKPSEAPRSGG
jgi:hypothetical protein